MAIRNRKSGLLLASAVTLCTNAAVEGATFVIQNNDSPGEGLNDPTPVAMVPGNPATTLGEQRLNAAQAAANAWGAVLGSQVSILVGMNFDPLPCNTNSGSLGRAGSNGVFRDYANAPLANTWYAAPLADALAGSDLDPGFTDIDAFFNSDVDFNDNCLKDQDWWYGTGGYDRFFSGGAA